VETNYPIKYLQSSKKIFCKKFRLPFTLHHEHHPMRQPTIQNILSISSGEICKALNAKRAHIEITLGKDQPVIEQSPSNNGHKKAGDQS